LGSCKSSTDTTDQRAGQFFDYDAIDYYHSDLYEESLEISENKSKSAIDSIKYGIVLGDIPDSISDVAFIDKLEKVGYNKVSVDESFFHGIDTVFRSRPCLVSSASACIYVYNDILIFKKEGKVIGTAKICFGCGAHQIKGTEVGTYSFGQCGGYDALEKTLKPLAQN